MKKQIIIISTIIILLAGIFFTWRYCIPAKVLKNGSNVEVTTTVELKLVSFKGNCEKQGSTGKTKIVKHNFISADTMKIELQTEVTCCVDFEGKIETKDKNIINLKYIETGEPCYCLCNGILEYEIKGVDKRKYQFQLNGVDIE